jgi:hypothetical protein
MRYFINIITSALAAGYIAPMFPAYWKEISKAEYERKLKEDD